MHAHEIVSHVLTTFRGLPKKMSRLFGKSEEWWRSHGRTPKSLDEFGTGNPSPVDGFIEHCERYEASVPASGKLLNEMVYAEIRFRLAEARVAGYAQNHLRQDLLKEAMEAICALDEKDIEQATRTDLTRWDKELSDLVGKAYEAQSIIRQQIARLIMGQ